MRNNSEIGSMQKSSNYYEAKELLNLILHQELPKLTLLNTLYGKSKSQIVYRQIMEFYESNSFDKYDTRKHIKNASQEISIKRSIVEQDLNFQNIQLNLLNNCLPDTKDLENFYGEYAQIIKSIFTLYNSLGLKRKCGIPATSHLNRVGAVIKALRMDDNESHKYQAIGVLHDTIEDLMFLVPDEKGKPYNFDAYEEFVKRFIPEELAESVKLLTNHFDLILDYCYRQLRKNNTYPSKENLLLELKHINYLKSVEIKEYANEIFELLEGEDLSEDIMQTSEWLCYKNLYIKDMAKLSDTKNNYRPFEIKAVDLSDNGHGKDSLAVTSKIKNIIKHNIWANEGYALKSTWQPLNNRVMEIQEDALVFAENLIIKDLLEFQSPQDFVASALLKIKDLALVLYE